MTSPTQLPAPLAWPPLLFLALVALLKWKHRRMWVEHRINRGLRAYAANRPAEPEPSPSGRRSFAI